MGWDPSSLLREGVLGGVKGVFEGVGEMAKDIRSAITGDLPPEKAAELEAKAQKLDFLNKQGQLEINKAEAKHGSMFVAGWRPFIGWICGISLGTYFIPKYFFATFLWIRVSWISVNNYMAQVGNAQVIDIMKVLPPYPISGSELIQLVGGILGLTLWRTLERRRGVARGQL